MRESDAITGRFVSVDPLIGQFPFYSSYQYAANSPIMSIDIDGMESSNNANQSEKAPEVPSNLYDQDKENQTYQKSDQHRQLVTKWNLVSTEHLDKIQGKLIFSRESSWNSGTSYYWYSSSKQQWISFAPTEYHEPADENPLKTIFWNGIIQPLLPIKDTDVYASASLKQKTSVSSFIPKATGASATIVYAGIQGGIISKEGTGFYGNVITGDNSYISYKFSQTGTEIRGLPFRGLGVTLTNNGPKYGEYAPELRVLQDTKLKAWGIPIQAEIGLKPTSSPTVGLRGKVESPQMLGWNGEVTAGFRLSLKVPDVISKMFHN